MLTQGRPAVLVCLALFHALQSAMCQQDTVCYKKVTQSYIQTQLIYFTYQSTCGTTLCYKTGTNVIYTTVMTYDTILDCCPGHENYPKCNAVCSQLCLEGDCTAPEFCECVNGWTGLSCDTDINECEVNNGGCSHDCTNTLGSYSCSCAHGYVLVSREDLGHCEDVNECEMDNGGCEQQCRNTNGSFFCSCDPSYSLQSDGKTCLLLELNLRYARAGHAKNANNAKESSQLPAATVEAEPETASSVLIPQLLLATVTAIVIALVITVAAVIVLCIMFNRNDSADTALRTTSLQTRVLSHQVRRASNRPIQNSTGSSRSPSPYTFIPVINPGYEIQTSIPAPSGMTGHRTNLNLTPDNQPRNFSQLSSGVRRLNPLYEGVDENEDTV